MPKVNRTVLDRTVPTIQDFSAGGTVRTKNDLFQNSKGLWQWVGSVPKPVPVGSTPESTGGVASDAWVCISEVGLQDAIGTVVKTYVNTTEMKADTKAVLGSTVKTLGYYSVNDGGGALWNIVRTADTNPNGFNIIELLGTSGLSAVLVTGVVLHPLQWGCKMDGVQDDTGAATNLINYFKTTKYTVLDFGSGTLLHSGLPNLVNPTTDKTKTDVNLTYKGSGSSTCFLKYTGTGTALTINAFDTGTAGTKQYLNNVHLEGVHVQGASAKTLVHIEGIARSVFSDIRVNGAATGGTDTGLGWKYGLDGTVGFLFRSIQLSSFYDCYCSYVDGDVPYRGVMFTQGNNGNTAAGACSNNRFFGLYAEGNGIGMQLASSSATQNVFTGGSQEACFVWGLIIGPDCQYNNFTGVGWESINTTGGDVQSSGRFTRYMNCYSSNKMLLSGDSEKIDGGIFERIEITTAAKCTTVEDVRINKWNSGKGGYVDSGTGTRFRNIYDVKQSGYVYPVKARITVPTQPSTTPFQYTNTLQKRVIVQVIGGTVTKVTIKSRGGLDRREVPKPTAAFTGTVGDYILEAGDVLEVSFSNPPLVQLTESQF